MSKAYIALKNFSFNEMMNLVCYGTKFPQTLTSSQKITRLYRSCLRRQNQLELEGLYGDVHKHFDQLQKMSSDFYKLSEINLNISNAQQQDKIDFQILIKKWEQWQIDNYEAHNYVEECRPYCSTSGRYLTFSNDTLDFDPFGYYKPRFVSDNRPVDQLPFFEDYPMNDSSWLLVENFPEGFKDGNPEADSLIK